VTAQACAFISFSPISLGMLSQFHAVSHEEPGYSACPLMNMSGGGEQLLHDRPMVSQDLVGIYMHQ
jgi:hypothetical protein